MMTATTQTPTRHLTFEVTTRKPLPAGQQVFIAGDREALGSWQADGFPLTRVDDNLWSGTTVLPDAQPVAYKVTRGSWASEQVEDGGKLPPNAVVPAGGDQTVRVRIHDWKDHLPGPPPQITGHYRIHEAFSSPRLRQPRRIIVWLPPSYRAETERRYPVLYMQDGEQVFDPQTSTWGQDWQVDERCTELIRTGRLRELIVVAAYSTEDRVVEYSPAHLGGEYAALVVEDLKPFIDAEYRTQPDRESTAVAGASMGGAISFYLAWTRPEVFFGAACLSPAFDLDGERYCLDMVKASAKAPDLKVFLYGGGGEPMEEVLLRGTREMAELLVAAGFRKGHNLRLVEDPEGLHKEATWAKHTEAWLRFLFGTTEPEPGSRRSRAG